MKLYARKKMIQGYLRFMIKIVDKNQDIYDSNIYNFDQIMYVQSKNGKS